jgi:SAM-dependent methyltransferase
MSVKIDKQLEQQDLCPQCGSDDLILNYHTRDFAFRLPGEFPVVTCADCGLTFLQERPNSSAIGQYYPDTYYSYSEPVAQKPGILKHLKISIKSLVRHYLTAKYSPLAGWLARRLLPIDWYIASAASRGLTSRVILDVGCGAGTALDFYRQFGWETYGSEISSAACETARSKDHKVTCGELVRGQYSAEAFHLIRMSHVIEHLHQPQETLKAIYEVLRSDGYLLIMAPNHGGWLAKLFGRWYWQVDAPRHLTHFNRKTLTAMLASAGFVVESFQTVSASIGASRSLGYYFTNQPGKNGKSESSNKLLVTWFIRVAGFVLALIARLTDSLKTGENCIVIAVKKSE